MPLVKFHNMNVRAFEEAKRTFNLHLIEKDAMHVIRLRNEFAAYFTYEKIASMDIEEYVVGLQSRDSFCYKLERTLYELGSISGQPSSKFGVWYSPTKNQYCFQPRFGDNYKDAFETLRRFLLDLLRAGEKEDYVAIERNPINSLIKGKILAVYYPEKYMNVYAAAHLNHYLETFGLASSRLLKCNVIYKRAALVKFKNEDKDMKDWSNYVFSIFLWSHYPKDPRYSSEL